MNIIVWNEKFSDNFGHDIWQSILSHVDLIHQK